MKVLNTPLNDEQLKNLKTGDTVYITGTIYTGRDAAHKRLVELIDDNKELPIEIDGSVIYYVGPTPTKPGKVIGSAGPTSSYRMDPYTKPLLELGLKGMIGKGPRDKSIVDLCKKHEAVYFAAVGGAAALISESIKKSEVVCYEDLRSEAVRKLEVENFPVIVAIDTKGNSLY